MSQTKPRPRTLTGTWDEFDSVHNLLWWQALDARQRGQRDDHDRLQRITDELRDLPAQPQDTGACWALPASDADRAYVAVRLRHAARRARSARRPVLYISAKDAFALADRFSPSGGGRTDG